MLANLELFGLFPIRICLSEVTVNRASLTIISGIEKNTWDLKKTCKQMYNQHPKTSKYALHTIE